MKSVELLKLEVLYSTFKLISGAFDLEDTLRKVLNTLGDKLEVKRAAIVLWDPEEKTLRIKASYGLSSEEEAKGVYDPGEGLTGKVFQTGQACAIKNVSSEPFFLNKTGARSLQKEEVSFIAVPIVIDKNPVGVLWVDRVFECGISLEEDLKFLELLSFFVAQLLELNASLEVRDASLKEENLSLKSELRHRLNEFVYASVSPKMLQVLTLIKEVAPTRATVLLYGESGTGKTLIARLIHELSPRKGGPFVKINCAALPESLLEAELFGYEKGAFTGAVKSKPGLLEVANKGTVLLDEVAELTPALQTKLLRFIQEREFERLGSTYTKKVDVRIIAATNQDLEVLVAKGKFREDLFYRLNVFPIRIPPLRERLEDIPGLVNFFVSKLQREYSKRVVFSPAALKRLMEYPWPGNVRELENFIERVFIVAKSEVVTEKLVKQLLKPSDLRLFSSEGEKSEETSLQPEPTPEEILNALKRNQFIIKRAARELGLTFRQLRYRIEKLGLDHYFAIKRGRPPGS